jgi:hypothetical protein
MTDLERRALLGDAEAQRECTEKGIVLTCPCCKNESELLDEEGAFDGEAPRQLYFVRCKSCFLQSGMYTSKIAALAKWNTRPAPPIGRCGECKHFYEDGDETSCSVNNLVFYKEHEYCSKFEPKDGEENGRTAAD